MDIEAKERLRNIARGLVDASYARACDYGATEEEFQETVDEVVNHLIRVRRRAQGLILQRQMA